MVNNGNINVDNNVDNKNYKSEEIEIGIKIRYQISKNKFCYNINRPHKNNNIMIEVDFDKFVLTQICWDPDCRGFRSQPFIIPEELKPDKNILISFLVNNNNNQIT